jgi:hypothetical protein
MALEARVATPHVQRLKNGIGELLEEPFEANMLREVDG